MTNLQELKDKLGKNTKKLEKAITPYYTNLEPYQRGLILIALTTFLIWIIYYLAKREEPKPRELTDSERKRIESLAEERILKRAEFLNRLKK